MAVKLVTYWKSYSEFYAESDFILPYHFFKKRPPRRIFNFLRYFVMVCLATTTYFCFDWYLLGITYLLILLKLCKYFNNTGILTKLNHAFFHIPQMQLGTMYLPLSFNQFYRAKYCFNAFIASFGIWFKSKMQVYFYTKSNSFPGMSSSSSWSSEKFFPAKGKWAYTYHHYILLSFWIPEE